MDEDDEVMGEFHLALRRFRAKGEGGGGDVRRRCVKGGAFASYRPSLSGTLSLSADREAAQRQSAPGCDGF